MFGLGKAPFKDYLFLEQNVHYSILWLNTPFSPWQIPWLSAHDNKAGIVQKLDWYLQIYIPKPN